MYRVMIVDDETLARVGIKSSINWQENGMELVGDFDNGKKAFDMIEILEPDIIITDIKMPVMDGIELIKATQEAGMDIKFIMLSAYDDFILVKEAMSLGAFDYVLKLQTDADNLTQILKNACAEVEKARKEKKIDSNARDLIRNQMTVLKNNFMRSVIQGKFGVEEDIQSKAEAYDIQLEPSNLVCLILRLENVQKLEKNGDLIRASIYGIVEEITSNYGNNYILMDNDEYVVLCSLSVNDIDSAVAAQMLAKALKAFLKDAMGIVITVGISKVYHAYLDISQAYKEANEAIDSNYVYLSGSIMQYAHIADSKKREEFFEMELNSLSDAIKTMNRSNTELGFERLKNKISEHQNISSKYIVNVCHILVYIINKFLNDNNIQADDFWGVDIDPYQQIANINTIDDFVVMVNQLQMKICNAIEGMGDNKIIMKAKQYINQHFCESISLEEVAEQLGFSPSYFSRYFSRIAGESFSNYVISLRINMAIELLKSSKYKVYEVASMVGYDNPHYFSRIFKKMTGYSPFEYKAQLPDNKT